MTKTFTLQEFFAQFPDNDACLAHLLEVRYGGSRFVCPKCRREANFYRIAKIKAYSCEFCGHHVHPMVGTPFAKSRTPLRSWFYAMYLFTTTRHGVPAKELQRQLGVTYKAAWRMGHELRKYMAWVDGDDSLDGHIEADETYIGGRRSGGKRGRGAPGKSVVFGMLERGGDIVTRVVPDASRKSLEPHVLNNVTMGARISTDEHRGYNRLGRFGYRHEAVNHNVDEWVRGDVHTNGIEGFWSQLKRSIRGTHVHVSRKHLPKYLGEFEYRFNMRKDPHLMFSTLVSAFACASLPQAQS